MKQRNNIYILKIIQLPAKLNAKTTKLTTSKYLLYKDTVIERSSEYWLAAGKTYRVKKLLFYS